MKEKSKEWLSRKGIDKWFQRDNLIILVLSGILLFIIALPAKETGTGGGTSADRVEAGPEKVSETKAAVESASAYGAESGYAAELEARLEEILNGVSGVGRVEVMITLASSEELIVEKDAPISSSQVKETDAAGGERATSQWEYSESTVYSAEGTASSPYVVMRLLPRVEGVLVVAEGAGKGSVNKSLVEMIQALFDVEAHKIKVVKMQ